MSVGDHRLYLHLGSPKTGTTYLQEILWNNRDALAHAGVLYPGDRPEAHFHAAMDLQGRRFQEDWFDPDVPGAWRDLVERARHWPGPVVFSHELFGDTEPADIERALSDLAFAEVHLVCTARDLVRQIPAVWQEDLKNRHTVSYAEFAAGVRGEDSPPHWLSDLFWQRQDLPRILGKWAQGIPPERVHVVTVPPPGQPPERIWERFAGLVGVDPDGCDTTVRQRNASLGVAEAELVRRLNHVLDGRVDWPVHDSVVKYQIASRAFGSRPARTPMAMPAEERPWVQDQAERMITELARPGYDVVGDLRELLPSAPSPQQGVHPDHSDDREVLDVAVEAIATLVRRVGELESEPVPGAAAPRPAGRSPAGARQALRRLCDRYPALAPVPLVYRGVKSGWSRRRGRR